MIFYFEFFFLVLGAHCFFLNVFFNLNCRDSVANMLVTSCRDNICRIWVQTLIPEDGLVDLQQIEAIANQNLRVQTQRHRRKIMQRLKHMK